MGHEREYSTFLDKFFLNRRIMPVLKHIRGRRVLDFGCHKEELKKILRENYEYQGCEKDYSVIKGKYDTIVMSAVLEYVPLKDINKVFFLLVNHLKENGIIIILTITKLSLPTIKLLVTLGLSQKEEVAYQHFWSKKELFQLSKKFNLNVIHHSYSNCFGHRIVILEKKKMIGLVKMSIITNPKINYHALRITGPASA